MHLLSNSVQHIRVACIHWWSCLDVCTNLGHCPSGSVAEHFVESQGIPRDEKNTNHSLDFLGSRKEEPKLDMRERGRKGEKNDRGRARAIASIRERKSRLSREFLPILRGLLFGPRVSPCGERVSRSTMQRRTGPRWAGLSLRLSRVLSFSLSFSPSTFYHRHHHYHHRRRHHHRRSARQGRAPSPSPSSFLRPLAPPRRPPHFPPRTPRSRRQHLTSSPRAPSPPSSFPLSFSFSFVGFSSVVSSS